MGGGEEFHYKIQVVEDHGYVKVHAPCELRNPWNLTWSPPLHWSDDPQSQVHSHNGSSHLLLEGVSFLSIVPGLDNVNTFYP